jgi:sec-independent protein translocase protein TatA
MSMIGPELFILTSPTDIVVILVVAALLFGGKKIPELAKGLGQGIRNFKSSIKDEEEAKEQEKKLDQP